MKDDFNDQDASVHTLVQRLERFFAKPSGRVVAFIAARPQEGTSSVARAYAMGLSDSDDHKVLVIDAGRPDKKFYTAHQVDPARLLSAAFLAGQPVGDVLSPLGNHAFMTRWSAEIRNRGGVAKLASDDALWTALRAQFGTIVIDAASLKDSPDGINFAAKADAAVIVVEAEKTRQPVVEHVRDTLRAAGANLAGVVLNKRRFYIPDKVYQNM